MFDMLFDHIGRKIKNLAVVIFVLAAFSSILAGFVFLLGMIVNLRSMELYALPLFIYLAMSLLVAILIIIIGLVFSWVSVFFIYGFGELIERASNLDDRLDELIELQAQFVSEEANTQQDPHPSTSNNPEPVEQ